MRGPASSGVLLKLRARDGAERELYVERRPLPQPPVREVGFPKKPMKVLAAQAEVENRRVLHDHRLLCRRACSSASGHQYI